MNLELIFSRFQMILILASKGNQIAYLEGIWLLLFLKFVGKY